MLNWINRKMKRKGFTLIEMVIVIAILGILIAIAVPRLAGFRDSAAKRADEATAETIEKAANLYVATHGEDGATALGAPATGGQVEDIEGFVETLQNAKLLDDSDTLYSPQQDGMEYEITYNEDNGEFTVEVKQAK